MWLIRFLLFVGALCYGVGWLVQHGYWQHLDALLKR